MKQSLGASKQMQVLAVFFIMMFVVGTDTFLVAPLLPILRMTFHVSTASSGWMVSTYALGYAMCALIAGPVSDGLDRKLVMVLGMLGFTISTFLCGFASEFWTMILFRFLAGVSAALASPQVWAAIATLLPQEQVVRGMGIAMAGLAVSQAIGVPIGSVLSNFGWQIPFLGVAITGLLVSILVWRFVPSVRPSQITSIERDPFLGRYVHLFRSTKCQLTFLAYFLLQYALFGRFSYIGIWLSDKIHVTETVIGFTMLWFGLGNLIGSLMGGRISHKLGQAKVVLYSFSFLTIISLIIPFCHRLVPIDMLWLITSFCFGVVFPVLMTLLQSLAPSLRGTISSMANALMYGGSTLGTWSSGWLYVHAEGFMAVSIQTAIGITLALCLFRGSGVLPVYQRKATICDAQ